MKLFVLRADTIPSLEKGGLGRDLGGSTFSDIQVRRADADPHLSPGLSLRESAVQASPFQGEGETLNK
jgi:hypothetical protein